MAGHGAVRLRLQSAPAQLSPQHGESVQVTDAADDLGDPVVVRRDGAPAYALVAVVDDASDAMTRIVRGRDLLAPALLQQAVAAVVLPVINAARTIQDTPKITYQPTTYFHPLLLESAEAGKWSKFHGAVAVPELSRFMTPEQLCGTLMQIIGFGNGQPMTPIQAEQKFSPGRN